jgi:hypothetical protein
MADILRQPEPSRHGYRRPIAAGAPAGVNLPLSFAR